MTSILGTPGSTELPLIRVLLADVKLLQSDVSGMADGYAQTTRRVAI